MRSLFPNLYSDLVPGVAAAGFSLGESFSDVSEKIGRVECTVRRYLCVIFSLRIHLGSELREGSVLVMSFYCLIDI